MVKSDKIYTVQNLVEKLKQAKALILADYHGLNVSQLAKLRQEVKKAGGEFEIVKNTLLGRAAKESKIKINPEVLQGPTAALWAYEDQIAPLKALMDFVKVNELPKIKFGLLDQIAAPIERIKYLASLPMMDELKVKLVNTLQSPIYGLANALNWNVKKLILLLNAKIKKQNAK